MRVLIAEDETITRHLMTALIARWGFEPVAAADGNEADAVMAGDNPPKVAVIDWMMPGMDGVEVCRRIRARAAGAAVHVILVSGKSREQDVEIALEAGADEVLSKPVDHGELERRLAAAADRVC